MQRGVCLKRLCGGVGTLDGLEVMGRTRRSNGNKISGNGRMFTSDSSGVLLQEQKERLEK